MTIPDENAARNPATPGPAAARIASTIMLVRDGPAGMEVFMVVRHHQIDFASGALVFPGGAVEPDDYTLAATPALRATTPMLDDASRAVRVAAVRETHEECGVLLAREPEQTSRHGEMAADIVGPTACAAVARRVAAGALFSQALAAEGLELALDALAPFAHWVTPRFLPKRFDTYFFVAAAPAHQIACHDGAESVESTWINPRAALEAAERGAYTIIFPTRLNLALLAQENTAETALAAARARRIVTVEPEQAKTAEGGPALRIPLEAGYGAEVFAFTDGVMKPKTPG